MKPIAETNKYKGAIRLYAISLDFLMIRYFRRLIIPAINGRNIYNSRFIFTPVLSAHGFGGGKPFQVTANPGHCSKPDTIT